MQIEVELFYIIKFIFCYIIFLYSNSYQIQQLKCSNFLKKKLFQICFTYRCILFLSIFYVLLGLIFMNKKENFIFPEMLLQKLNFLFGKE